ncbi:MAG: LTA synthase family protein [Oscillospiraceae bacterium]|nr:LTA synthase family protein [Oscillospiraceae bacterium]
MSKQQAKQAKRPKKASRPDRSGPLARRMPAKNRGWFLLYQLFLLLLASAALCYVTLRLSYSNLNEEIFLGYWEDLWIPLMNLLLIYGLCLSFFALLGRAWLAWLITALICLGVAAGNYYLIIIRSDALQFQDLLCLREALAITNTQGYELELSPRIWIALSVGLGLTLPLALLSRWRPRWGWNRLLGLALSLGLLVGVACLGVTGEMFDLTKNYTHVNTWSVTEIYASRGVIYSFARTIFTGSGKPSGYSAQQAKETLESYTQEEIPNDRKVDVFVIMRESYSDLSELPCDEDALDFSAYDDYHALVKESVYFGNLVTNGFGGNTKDAERCFLTGYYNPKDWRKPTNSYVWYLKTQGYYAEGAHPFNGWFYNRLNINRYLGFDDYLLREDGFDELVGADKIAEDEVLFDRVWQQYQDFLAKDQGPYFNFTVTYEGHGPYNYAHNKYGTRYVLKDANTPDGIAMNNYLSIAAHRDRALLALVEKFRASDRPIVLLTYGDHKATLGKDINNYTTSAYQRYGMDLDLSTPEGFYNYYSTDYVIWMNDAAKARLGYTGKGLETGPTISPCYLMNLLFDTLDWGKGPAFLQAMGDLMEDFPVYSTKGRISIRGELSTTIPGDLSARYHLMQYLSYYQQTNFMYQDLSK